jgi:hypothetical protein
MQGYTSVCPIPVDGYLKLGILRRATHYDYWFLVRSICQNVYGYLVLFRNLTHDLTYERIFRTSEFTDTKQAKQEKGGKHSPYPHSTLRSSSITFNNAKGRHSMFGSANFVQQCQTNG